MFILEKLESENSKPEKWTMYAQYETRGLLEKIIKNKKHPERFRIIECDTYELPKRAERCLLFRIYDSCTAERVEEMLDDRGIEFISKNMGECILFNVMRPSNMRWYQIIELVTSICPVKHYFANVELEGKQECA